MILHIGKQPVSAGEFDRESNLLQGRLFEVALKQIKEVQLR